jgi:hypothetical protein
LLKVFYRCHRRRISTLKMFCQNGICRLYCFTWHNHPAGSSDDVSFVNSLIHKDPIYQFVPRRSILERWIRRRHSHSWKFSPEEVGIKSQKSIG